MLSIHPCIYQSACLPVCLSVCLPACPSVCLPINQLQSADLSPGQSPCLLLCLSIHPSVLPSIYLRWSSSSVQFLWRTEGNISIFEGCTCIHKGTETSLNLQPSPKDVDKRVAWFPSKKLRSGGARSTAKAISVPRRVPNPLLLQRASRESTSACRRTGPCSQSPFETFLKKGAKDKGITNHIWPAGYQYVLMALWAWTRLISPNPRQPCKVANIMGYSNHSRQFVGNCLNQCWANQFGGRAYKHRWPEFPITAL